MNIYRRYNLLHIYPFKGICPYILSTNVFPTSFSVIFLPSSLIIWPVSQSVYNHTPGWFFSPKCMIIYITQSSAQSEGFLSTLAFRSRHLWDCACVACRAISKLHLSAFLLRQLIGHIPWGLRYILTSRRHFKRNKIHRPRGKLFQVTYLYCSCIVAQVI